MRTGLEPVTSALSIRPVGSGEVPANARKPFVGQGKVGVRCCPCRTAKTRLNPLDGGRKEDAAYRRLAPVCLGSGLAIRDRRPLPLASVDVDADQDIERAARRLAETAGSPVRVILFGSHARDDARPGSDLDFLVIEPHVPDQHAEMVRLRSALHDLRRPIDVLVYSDAQVEEWGDVPGTALHAALTEGRVLVEA
jgi:predicted nucleotidyltransferase